MLAALKGHGHNVQSSLGYIGLFHAIAGYLNALAMEPLGHIAGIAAALIGSVATFISLPSGILVAQLFDGTVVPLVAGFAILGFLSFCVVYVTEKGEIGKASV